MELREALRTTAAVREFTTEPVADEILYRILDVARFAPSGGNRQGWHIVVVKDPATRARLRDLYLAPWRDYLAQRRSGLVPFAPVNDPEAERQAVERSSPSGSAGDFAEHLDQVPVLLVLLADLGALTATDRDLPRYSIVGGGSVYPFAWSLLLAARAEGLGGVMTTMLARSENEVKALLDVPDRYVVAAAIALGYPRSPVTRLRRRTVEELCSIDRFSGPQFSVPHD